MAKFRISVEGDDKDELVTALTEALTDLLGGEAPSSGEEGGEGGGEEGGENDLLGGGDEPEVDPREEIKPLIVKLSKHAKGPDKVRAIFKKAGGNRLQDIKDAKLEAVIKAIRAVAKELKIKE